METIRYKSPVSRTQARRKKEERLQAERRRDRSKQAEQVQSDKVSFVLESRGLGFTSDDLTSALDQQLRTPGVVALSKADEDFWQKHAGTPKTSARVAMAANAAAAVISEARALSGKQVSERLDLKESTIRHYRSSRKLYSYLSHGKAQFPLWQFNEQSSIPHLDEVLRVLPADLHPQTVEGFFKTKQPDLSLMSKMRTPKEWLVLGGSPQRVIARAEGLGEII